MLTVANTMSTDELKALLKKKVKKAKDRRSDVNEKVILHIRAALSERGVK